MRLFASFVVLLVLACGLCLAEHNDGLCNAPPGHASLAGREVNSCAGYVAVPYCEAELDSEIGQAPVACAASLRGVAVPSFDTGPCGTGSCTPRRVYSDVAAMDVAAASSVQAPFPMEFHSPDQTYWSSHYGLFSGNTYTCNAQSTGTATRPRGCGLAASVSVDVDGPQLSAHVGNVLRMQATADPRASIAVVPSTVDKICDSLLTGTCTLTASFLADGDGSALGARTFFTIGDKAGNFVRLRFAQDESKTNVGKKLPTSCSGTTPGTCGQVSTLAVYDIVLEASVPTLPWTTKRVAFDGAFNIDSLWHDSQETYGASATPLTLTLQVTNGLASASLAGRWLSDTQTNCVEFGQNCCLIECTFDADNQLVTGSCADLTVGSVCGSFDIPYNVDTGRVVQIVRDLDLSAGTCAHRLSAPVDALLFGDRPAHNNTDPSDASPTSFTLLYSYDVTYNGGSLISWDADAVGGAKVPFLDATVPLKLRDPPARDPCCDPDVPLCAATACEREDPQGPCNEDGPCTFPDPYDGPCDVWTASQWRFKHRWFRRRNVPYLRLYRTGSKERFMLKLDDVIESVFTQKRPGKPLKLDTKKINPWRLRWRFDGQPDPSGRNKLIFTLTGRSRYWRDAGEPLVDPEQLPFVPRDLLADLQAEDQAYQATRAERGLTHEQMHEHLHAATTTTTRHRARGKVPFKKLKLTFEVCPHGTELDIRFLVEFDDYRWLLNKRVAPVSQRDRSVQLKWKVYHKRDCTQDNSCGDGNASEEDGEGDEGWVTGCPKLPSGLTVFNDKPQADVIINSGDAAQEIPVSFKTEGSKKFFLRYNDPTNADWNGGAGFDSLIHDPEIVAAPVAEDTTVTLTGLIHAGGTGINADPKLA